MLLGTLGASLLGHLVIGKGIVRAGTGNYSLNSSTSNCHSPLLRMKIEKENEL